MAVQYQGEIIITDIIKHNFRFMATGIGSVPFMDTRTACTNILKRFPGIPFWPQLVKRSHLEDMNIQFSEGLPLLEIDEEGRSLVISSGNMEHELVKFYDRFLAEDLEYFAISREYAAGLHEVLSSIQEIPGEDRLFIKGQTVGPVTFAAAITGQDGKSVLYNPDLLEAMVKGLAIKSLWQVKELIHTGKNPIIFIDEPYLSGFGSAFSPIQRDDVISLIKEVIEFIRSHYDVLIGVHCCGNTDWSMIVDAGPDIISFDAFGYMDRFLLYQREVTQFLKDGGVIAWGVVPTLEFTGKETMDGLHKILNRGLNQLYEWGIDPETVARQSVLTPACGTGTMGEGQAGRVLELLSMLSEKMRS